MRRLMLGAAFMLGCGTTTDHTCPSAESTLTPQAVTPRGLPNQGTWRLAVLVGPGVHELEVYGLWYPLVAQGWRVTVAAPEGGPLHGADGLPVPTARTYAALDPAAFDAVYVPGGAPGAAAAVAKAFKAAGKAVITTTAGAAALEGQGLTLAVATDDEMVIQKDGVWSAARPGDLPRLAHALSTWADDALRAAHKSTGGVPP